MSREDGVLVDLGLTARIEKTNKEWNVSAHIAGTAGRDQPSTSSTGTKERKGKILGGAGVKLNLRFLQQGLTPEGARAKVDGQVQEREKTSPLATAETSRGQRGSEHTFRAQAPSIRTGKPSPLLSVKPIALAGGFAKITKVGILPEEYSRVMFDAALSSSLEEALVEAMEWCRWALRLGKWSTGSIK
ncbi:hypothetical protein Trydic_g23959 [Trypoxylus dichotomus]